MGRGVVLRYLEYLIFEARNEDSRIHTELACLQVQQLVGMCKPYVSKEGETAKIDQIKANADQAIFKARKDLVKLLKFSKHYDPREVLSLLPEYYLHKEKALILAKQKKFKQAMVLCVK